MLTTAADYSLAFEWRLLLLITAQILVVEIHRLISIG